MPDLPGDYLENGADVLQAINLIEDGLIPAMQHALGTIPGYTFKFQDTAISMFRRRYRMAITKAIAAHPNDDHLGNLRPVMEAQARIAGAIALFRASKPGPPPQPGSEVCIDIEALKQATHVMENECVSLTRNKTAQGTLDDVMQKAAIYCS